MQNAMATQNVTAQGYTLVVGLGITGLSAVRYLSALGERIVVVDSRERPPQLPVLQQQFPQVEVHTGAFDAQHFCQARRIVVSPGVALTEPALQAAQQAGVEIIGDIDLFASEVRVPVAAITGSNGKSTVTALLSAMLEQSGKRVLTGGNIGTPALELLRQADTQQPADACVLELSSFQLETLQRLPMQTAVVLNISADHMDRYPNMETYIASKLSIYRHAENAVINLDDAVLRQQVLPTGRVLGFSLRASSDSSFGVDMRHGERYLAFEGECLLAVDALKMRGEHNIANALAALALGTQMAVPMAAMLQTLQSFGGLAHRTQWVAEIDGVNWYNDSKATNVGATVAAIRGLPGRHVLIAGGEGKAADFSALAEAARERLSAAVLIGRDAGALATVLAPVTRVERAADMDEAVRLAASLAQRGDNVLLSPACASFDMFDSFEHRGEMFMQAVRERLS